MNNRHESATKQVLDVPNELRSALFGKLAAKSEPDRISKVDGGESNGRLATTGVLGPGFTVRLWGVPVASRFFTAEMSLLVGNATS
jgi:hypothetical protein